MSRRRRNLLPNCRNPVPAAVTSYLLCLDDGKAGGGTDVGGVRVRPQGRDSPPLIAALQRSEQGPLRGTEGVPVSAPIF